MIIFPEKPVGLIQFLCRGTSTINAETVFIALGVLILLGALAGGWLDMAYLGLAVRTWGFGSPRQLPRKKEKAVLHHRFGKLCPIIGWLMNPWEVIVTNRRFILNYRNAFNRLDIPLESIRTIKAKRRPWPLADDILIGYTDTGTPKQFFLADNHKKVIAGLKEAGAKFDLEIV